MKNRTLQQIIQARPTTDGVGVKIRRIAGQDAMRQMDPFLMVDEIRSEQGADYVGGFPPHPHRGFETITYMLEGAMRHKDHMGNEGVIGSGDVQWMSAGRGVIHSEMPEQTDGMLHGFQLWLNLPASEKMKPASYQEISHTQIPRVNLGDAGSLRVLAGQFVDDAHTVQGPVVQGITQASYLDVDLQGDASVDLPIPAEHTVLVLVFEGSTTQLGAGQMGVYHRGDVLALTAGEEGARLLILAGAPLGEPIAQHGPFVMNTAEEIEQAIQDYNNGRLV